MTTTDLIRQAARELVSRHAREKSQEQQLRSIFLAHAPKPPKRMRSPAQVARYKKALREYDAIALDLGLQDAIEIQTRNSIHQSPKRPALTGHL